MWGFESPLGHQYIVRIGTRQPEIQKPVDWRVFLRPHIFVFGHPSLHRRKGLQSRRNADAEFWPLRSVELQFAMHQFDHATTNMDALVFIHAQTQQTRPPGCRPLMYVEGQRHRCAVGKQVTA